MPLDHLLYGLAWMMFGAAHSLLASHGAKRRLAPLFGPWYRLAYNLFALTTFAGVVLAGRAVLGDWPRFPLPPLAIGGMAALHGAGWLVLLAALRGYDGGRLLGLSQIRHRDEPEDEALRTEGFHRYVRHPLYLGALLILWGAAVSPLGLATAAWGTLYLAVGTWFEERKLLALYGARYADYRRRVPAVIPWKGRAI